MNAPEESALRTTLTRVALLAGGAALLPAAARAQTAAVPRFEPVAPGEFPVSIPTSREATLGYLVVWENRATKSTTIKLPVAVVRAATPSTKEPVLFLTGGPGSGGLSPAAYPGAYPWTADRDFIVFGQRGTQYAQPALECPELEEAFARVAGLPSGPERERTLGAAARSCRDRLQQDGVDLSAYHTDAISEDIDELASVLGVPRLVVFALSYGTRIALDLARDFPSLVAAMVLDSALPPDVRYDDESAESFRQALEAVAVTCSADLDCERAYPDLRDRFFASLDSAEALPIEVRLGDPDRVVHLDGARLASLVGLGSPSEVRSAPQRMAAIATRDPDQIRPLISLGYSRSGFSWGMRVSVWCSEAWPFSRRALTSSPGTTLGGYESAAIAPPICEEWGVPARPVAFVQPVRSAIPTLLIAGEFDPATPPDWGRRALRFLENGRLLVVRGGTHTPSVQWDGDGCAMTVAAEFVSDPAAWLANESEPACPTHDSGSAFLLPGQRDDGSLPE